MEKDRKGGFKSIGEFLVKVRKACDGEGMPDSRLVQKTTGHMEIGQDSQGGYLVPEEWAEGIYHVALETAIVRPRAVVLSTKRDSLKIRTLVDTSRASNYFGGITFQWAAEAAEKSYDTITTKPALGQLELTPHKLIGSMFSSNELEDDYGAFGEFMQIAFGRALRFEEDYHFIWGTGAGEPLGIVNAPATVAHARAAGFGAPVVLDMAHMAARLLPDSWARAVWLINPTVLSGWAIDATGGANTYAMLDLSTLTCLGRPIIPSEKCAASGTIGDIILADWSHYVIADRSIEISGSREAKAYGDYGFLTDETFWRVVLRVAGQPIMDAPITPRNGADTLSAFVVLTSAS